MWWSWLEYVKRLILVLKFEVLVVGVAEVVFVGRLGELQAVLAAIPRCSVR